ncbi:uncharacterized protein, partial [Argopecten irradians]|uniref:uncharacterized protein n=1 Tax=Argopecten irradians TaxID=31199 RepID=UPI00371178B2
MVIDTNNDALMSHIPPNSSSHCSNQGDFYGNLQVDRIVTNTSFELLVNVTHVPKPDYVGNHAFGVTDVDISTVIKTIAGSEHIIKTTNLHSDPQSNDPKHLMSFDTVINNERSAGHLTNGERLCLRFISHGGGHLTSKNLISDDHDESLVPFSKTRTTKDLCYHFDDAHPIHCLESYTCVNEPLDAESRILTCRNFQVIVNGWEDPTPVPGNLEYASGIDTYSITVYEVKEAGPGQLEMGRTPVGNIHVNANQSSEIRIPYNLPNPAIYGIVLDVKDVANNLKQARRFVIFDNSSEILARNDNPLCSTTATASTGCKWQTNHDDLCYSWKDSGLYSVDWSLGTTFGGHDIGNGSLGVARLGPNETCPEHSNCYCPSVGVCAYYNFSLSLNSLVHLNTHNGNHNRVYHFTLSVTNDARLSFVEHKEVLADDSPPASIRVTLAAEGQYFVTVVAYNNAMESSDPVCSDGIVLDKTPPLITNVTFNSATSTESMVCSEGKAWYITRNLTRYKVSDGHCDELCRNTTVNEFLSLLPVEGLQPSQTKSCSISDGHGTTIYLPIDLIDLQWGVIDTGSQIRDVYIAVGSTEDSSLSPDLIDYHISSHTDYYKSRHVGLSDGDEIYIFVKNNKQRRTNIYSDYRSCYCRRNSSGRQGEYVSLFKQMDDPDADTCV